MSHQGKPSTSTAPTPDAAQFVSRGGKGGRGRGGGGGRGQSLNKQQQQKTRQNPPGSGNGAQQGSKSTRPPAAGPAGGAAPAQNGKDGAAPKQQTQSYVPKVTPPATSNAVPQPAPAVAGAQQLPTPTTTPASAQPTPAQQGGAAAEGNAAAIQAPSPSPHAPQPRPPVAASGGQGPAPPFVGFTNGAGAPPPAGGRGRGIPPRTQSAPPNLKEQKQAAIFIPARATPNPAAFPGAPYYPPPGAPYYPQPPPGVQPGVSPTHPYAPPGQGGVPPPRGAIYQPPTHGRSQVPPGAQGGPPQGGMGGPPPHAGQVGGPQMGPQQPMGPPSGYVPGHRLPPFVPGRAPYMPRGPAGMQPMGPPPHSMPIQIPQQKRRSSRIAIIDPQTGQEVNTSPPKDDLPGESSGSAGTSPYQHSPPSSGLRPTGGIMSHPYAPGGSSPSRQAPPFKPDMGAADFSDSEQFAPNHPYAPGRSAAIPIIDKPSSSPIVITTPPQMRAAAAAAEQAKTTAEEPAKDQTAAVTDAAPVKEADKKEEKEEEKEEKKEEDASPLPEAATKEEEKQPETKTDAEVEAKPAEVQPTKDEAKAEEVKAEPAAQEKDTTEEKEEKKAAAEEQPLKEAESQPTKEAEPTTKEEAAAPTTEKAAEEPSKAGKQKPAAATEDAGKKASADSKKTKSGSRKAVSSKKGDEGESKAAVVAPSTDKKEDQPPEKKEAEEPAKKDEAEPQAEEKPAETEQDDDDWEVKAEKEDLVLQKDVSLRPTYAGSNAPGSFRPTINPQAEASWNGSGTKRTYDRDFLLKFQTYCRERPEGLPSVEVILGNEDKGKGGGGGRGGKGGRGGMGSSGEWSRGAQQQFSGRGGRGGPGMPGMPFAPVPGKFGAPPGLAAPIARGPGGRGGGPPGGPIRRGPKKIPGRETPPPGIMPPPEPVAPMADNPSVWKPSRRRGDDNEEIYGKVRSILNKITGDKFGPLSQQMVDLLKSRATDVEILREIINIIFDKALAEPGFSTMYAELCRVLEKNCPTFETNKEGKPQTFKRILLNRCQEAFEHKPHDETVDNDPLKKEEADMKQKRRMIGNIVFIGELYKEHMLTDKIMHECVFRRLLGDIKNPVEADLEALCKLMNTIGKVLDVPKAKGYMDAYFKRMKSLTQNPNIPSRIRFLLLDVLDLRANRWTSSVTEKPVKPGAGGRGGAPQQQHKPAPAPAGGRGAAYRPAGAGGPSHGPHGGPRGNAEGWETVGRGGHRGGGGDRGGGGGGGGGERGPPVTLSSGEVVLGPNQSRMGPTMGGTGAKGWRDASKRPQDSRRDATPASRPGSGPAPAPAKGNIFAALSDISEKSPQAESRQAGRPASRDRSRSREGREPQPSPRGGDRAEKASEPLPSPRSRAEKEDEAVVGPLDPETEKSIKLLLEEFLDTQDEDEARQCVDDIDATGFQPHLVKAIIVMATEKKEVVREMLLQLITHFTKKSTITAPQFVAGLRLVLEQLDDIKLDAPLAPKVVGQFMGSALLDNYLEASFVMPALEPLVESGSAISVLVGLFNFYIENTSIGETRDFVKEAGWDITSMFKTSSRNATSISEWLQVNNLDTVFPMAWAHGKLQAMLASGDDAEKILQWIDENVSKETSRDEEFAQRLTRLFLDFVAARTKPISEQDKVVEEETNLFRQYAPLLKKFLSDSQAQVDCLSVVQRFCFEQNFPGGLLERLFQELNDAEVVDEEAFHAWAADKQDSFGKSQALAQLASWLNGLA